MQDYRGRAQALGLEQGRVETTPEGRRPKGSTGAPIAWGNGGQFKMDSRESAHGNLDPRVESALPRWWIKVSILSSDPAPRRNPLFYSITESRWRGASDSTRGASAPRILPMSVKTTPLHCNIATRCRVSIRKFILQAVEITCQGHSAIVLFSPSMKILNFAALLFL